MIPYIRPLFLQSTSFQQTHPYGIRSCMHTNGGANLYTLPVFHAIYSVFCFFMDSLHKLFVFCSSKTCACSKKIFLRTDFPAFQIDSASSPPAFYSITRRAVVMLTMLISIEMEFTVLASSKSSPSASVNAGFALAIGLRRRITSA